jgi:hypothetical protein
VIDKFPKTWSRAYGAFVAARTRTLSSLWPTPWTVTGKQRKSIRQNYLGKESILLCLVPDIQLYEIAGPVLAKTVCELRRNIWD